MVTSWTTKSNWSVCFPTWTIMAEPRLDGPCTVLDDKTPADQKAWQMTPGKSLWPVRRVAVFMKAVNWTLWAGQCPSTSTTKESAKSSAVKTSKHCLWNGRSWHERQVATVTNGSKSWKIDLGGVPDMHEKKEVFHAGGQDLVCYSNLRRDCTCQSQRDITAYAWTQQDW